MARRKSTKPKKEKKSPTRVRPVERKHNGKVTEPYAIMEGLLKNEPTFGHIRLANIKLWWQKDWKVDADGIATGAMVCKASEIDRNLVEEYVKGESPDVFIKLAEKNWPFLDEKHKERLIFHELCHVHPAKDANGEQKRDTKDRPLWRIGRHPIQAFHEELAKYGAKMVIGGNDAILDAMRKADEPLLAQAEKDAATPAAK